VSIVELVGDALVFCRPTLMATGPGHNKAGSSRRPTNFGPLKHLGEQCAAA